MRVILQKDVKNLGQAGDIVEVKKGYARHLLFPKKWAIVFTEGSKVQAQHRKFFIESKKKKALKSRQTLVEKLRDVKISFIKEADNSGNLFGSVTVFEISKQLYLQGYEVDKKIIKLTQPLKMVGDYNVSLDFGSDIKTEIKVNISSENAKKEAEQEAEQEEEPIEDYKEESEENLD